jgi:hypothetical protein
VPVPELVGNLTRNHDGRYRMWTVDHIPFDEIPAYDPGTGVGLVAVDGWGLNWYGDALYAYRKETDEYHPLHGQRGYSTRNDANRAWYDAGLMGLMAYENVAAQFGLPSTLGWARHEPETAATECGHDGRRIGTAQTATWSRLLDPNHDGATDMWEGATDLYAGMAISTYEAADEEHLDRPTYVEAEYAFVICEDRNDPGGTELHSWYTYVGLADASSFAVTDGRLKVFLVEDIAATLKSFGLRRDMHDVVWNGSAAVADAEWARLGVDR